jgi:hypothetical protein
LAPVDVGAQLSPDGLYLPPELKYSPLNPPQTIICVPVHTAVCDAREAGQFAPVEVANQLSLVGLYLPPVLTYDPPESADPPQTTISVPVQTAVWSKRPVGTPAPIDVFIQLSVDGL